MLTVSMTARRLGFVAGVLMAGALALGAFALSMGATATRAQDAPDVTIGDGGELGQILVDKDGLTLYIFTRDEPGTSNCSGGCAMAWPPLTTTNPAVNAPDSIKDGFSLIQRGDGSMQVTYKGMPLYRYAGDTAAGQTTGQGVGGVWFVAQP